MEDWKLRLIEEYNQLKERYDKLRAFNNKKGIEHILSDNTEVLSREEKRARKKELYQIDLLEKQQKVMEEYLHLLEIRAGLQGIDLITKT